jgi:hypothetical protein
MGRILRWIVCGLLVLNLCGIAVSLWSLLFGPWEDWAPFLGAAGFVMGMLATVLATDWAKRNESACRSIGLVRDPQTAEAMYRWFLRTIHAVCATAALALMAVTMVGIAATVAIAGMGSAGHMKGGPPVFTPRPEYVVVKHGQRTEIPRWLYVFHGAGFYIGWHVGAAAPSLVVLQFLLTGASSSLLKKGR